MKGILLFGHGARDAEWARPFHAIRQLMREREPHALVELGFLELMAPGFDEGVARLVAQGVTEIVVIPGFMAAGSHVRKDLPRLAADAMERHPGTKIQIAAPVGEAGLVLAAMADYALATSGEGG